MIEVIFEPISADVEKSVKKTRGRPKLTDEEKKQRLLERKQNSLSGHSLSGLNVCKPKGRPKVLTDEEREQRKVLTKEQREARNEYLKNYFKNPEVREKHLTEMRKYNLENKEELKKKRPMYLKNYVNNLIKREVEKLMSEK